MALWVVSATAALLVPDIKTLTAPPPSAQTSRLALRDELLSLLPTGAGPCRIEAGSRLEEVVSEIELLEAVPASSGFLALGTSGAWGLRAIKPSDELAATETPSAAPLVEVLDVGLRFDAGTSTASAKFRVLADELDGTLEVGLTAGLDPDRDDTMYLVTNGRKLLVPRAPSCDVGAMMAQSAVALSLKFLTSVVLKPLTAFMSESSAKAPLASR